MIDRHTALLHHFLEMPVTQWIVHQRMQTRITSIGNRIPLVFSMAFCSLSKAEVYPMLTITPLSAIEPLRLIREGSRRPSAHGVAEQGDGAFDDSCSILGRILDQFRQVAGYRHQHAQRSALLPDIRTVSSLIGKPFDVGAWTGILAPAGPDPAIINLLGAEVPRALKQPKVREVLASSGAEAVASTPVEFQNFIVKEIDKWGSIIEASNLQ